MRRGEAQLVSYARPSLPFKIDQATEHATVALDVQPGEVLLLYTDGVVDAENREGNPFGLDRLQGALCQQGAVAGAGVVCRARACGRASGGG